MTDKKIKVEGAPAGSAQGETNVAQQQWVEEKLSQHLDAHVDELDFNVTTRLAASRRQALAQLDHTDKQYAGSQSRGFPWINQWQAGFVAMAIVGVIGYQVLSNPAPVQEIVEAPGLNDATGLIEDMRMLSAGDDLEFFQNLELLEWLDNDAV